MDLEYLAACQLLLHVCTSPSCQEVVSSSGQLHGIPQSPNPLQLRSFACVSEKCSFIAKHAKINSKCEMQNANQLCFSFSQKPRKCFSKGLESLGHCPPNYRPQSKMPINTFSCLLHLLPNISQMFPLEEWLPWGVGVFFGQKMYLKKSVFNVDHFFNSLISIILDIDHYLPG